MGSFRRHNLNASTHSEAPWVDARQGLSVDEASQKVIEPLVMRDFYRNRISQTNG